MHQIVANPSLRVAIYQYAPRDEPPEMRLQRLDGILRTTRDGPFDLVVCPELFLSGYNVGPKLADFSQPRDGSFSQAAAEIARRHQAAVIYGYPETAGERRFNSAIAIGKNGRQLANHRKLRLPKGFESDWFVPGDSYTMVEIAGFQVAILICYDVEFPESVRACVLAGADVVVAPTALKEEWKSVARQLIPTRAFENGVFLLYANYCGQENGFIYLGESCVIGPDGAEIARAGAQEELLAGVLNRQEIAPARTRLPYLDHHRGLSGIAMGKTRRPIHEPDAN